jgi:hypothetical protein
VAQLDGALALPPRRLADSELPLGGYSDVATRGLPEQILPGQFALDPDEFLRRFAGRELLYFHREEPHAPATRELLLLIDQGVRTWGDVRLVLAAAALALARQAGRREIALRIAATSNGGQALDALGAGAERLGELLEASDLSPNPAVALGRLLESLTADPGPRDLILLTHPKNLAEPAVVGAAGRAAEGLRLFAVAVGADGEVALSELRLGAPVAIARCRVRLDRPPPPEEAATSIPSTAGRWSGDVESIGFPFRLGVLTAFRDQLIAFDDAGEWVLFAGSLGLLHAWRADGTESEILPRATIDGMVLDEVDAVVGVAGGFVVVGTVGGRVVLAHYNFHRRTCSARHFGRPLEPPLRWSYVRHLHSVVASQGGAPYFAIDLALERDRSFYPNDRGSAPRAARAYQLAEKGPLEPIVLPDCDDIAVRLPDHARAIVFHPEIGLFGIRDGSGAWRMEAPLVEGRPRFVGSRLIRARWQGDVLAALIQHQDRRRVIYVFSVSGPWRSLGEHVVGRDVEDFALSRDGRRLAWRLGSRQLVAREVDASGPPSLVTPKGKIHPKLDVALGYGFLTAQAGRHAHLVRWDRDRLEMTRREGAVHGLVAKVFGQVPPSFPVPASRPRPRWSPDPRRIIATVRQGRLVLAVDRFGQVAVLGPAEDLVCMFFFFRDQAAAWAPDGSRMGPVPLIGGPETPLGAERIAAALRAAAEGRRSSGS